MEVAIGTEVPLAKPPMPSPPCKVTSKATCYKDTQSRILPGFAPAGLMSAFNSKEQRWPATRTCGNSWEMEVYEFKCEGTPPKKANGTTQEYYEAMFKRIDAHVATDSPLVKNAVADLQAASAARAAVNASFKPALGERVSYSV
eukprot:gene26627-21558_t